MKNEYTTSKEIRESSLWGKNTLKKMICFKSLIIVVGKIDIGFIL